MATIPPPAADDEDAYVFFDHRALESEIVQQVSERLAPEHELSAREDGEELFVTYRGMEHRVPLTISPHDRYVAISSLAELLKNDYRFFVFLHSHDTDTHGVLVVPASRAQSWAALPQHLAPLQLGFDYFHGLQIPYLNHEGSAPDFASASEAIRATSDLKSTLLASGLFTGRADPNAVAALARLAVTNPKVREQLHLPNLTTDASEAEIAAEIQRGMDEAFQNPEANRNRRTMQNAMEELWKITGGPPQRPWPKRPWWKFW